MKNVLILFGKSNRRNKEPFRDEIAQKSYEALYSFLKPVALKCIGLLTNGMTSENVFFRMLGHLKKKRVGFGRAKSDQMSSTTKLRLPLRFMQKKPKLQKSIHL